MLLLAALNFSFSAGQNKNICWCNNDQYGCWIYGENDGRDYIMLWNESAWDFIMGKVVSGADIPTYNFIGDENKVGRRFRDNRPPVMGNQRL